MLSKICVIKKETVHSHRVNYLFNIWCVGFLTYGYKKSVNTPSYDRLRLKPRNFSDLRRV